MHQRMIYTVCETRYACRHHVYDCWQKNYHGTLGRRITTLGDTLIIDAVEPLLNPAASQTIRPCPQTAVLKPLLLAGLRETAWAGLWPEDCPTIPGASFSGGVVLL